MVFLISIPFYNLSCLKQMLGKGGTAVVPPEIYQSGKQLLKKSCNLLIPRLPSSGFTLMAAVRRLWVIPRRVQFLQNLSAVNVLLFIANRYVHKDRPHSYDP